MFDIVFILMSRVHSGCEYRFDVVVHNIHSIDPIHSLILRPFNFLSFVFELNIERDRMLSILPPYPGPAPAFTWNLDSCFDVMFAFGDNCIKTSLHSHSLSKSEFIMFYEVNCIMNFQSLEK